MTGCHEDLRQCTAGSVAQLQVQVEEIKMRIHIKPKPSRCTINHSIVLSRTTFGKVMKGTLIEKTDDSGQFDHSGWIALVFLFVFRSVGRRR
jgi:hypothetical protein